MAWQELTEGAFQNLDVTEIQRNGVRFFMSGDGHRNPLFQWARRAEGVRGYFDGLKNADQLCLHVETLPAAADQAPTAFSPYAKVFGFEPPQATTLEAALTAIPGLLGALNPPRNALDTLKQQVRTLLATVRNIGLYDDLANSAADLDPYRIDLLEGHPLRPGLDGVLGTLNRQLYRIRDDWNALFGRRISEVIAQHPDDTHLISIGDAHLRLDTSPYNFPPVQDFIDLGDDAGWIDPSQR